ncbi:MAG: F0F1 ATP synthase subunit [Pseudomonadales bacterium]|nr:F0F1 ATP synthase subunit [Pseudomonadales bacterium]
MSDEPDKSLKKQMPTLAGQIGVKAARRLRTQHSLSSGVWFGLGTMGLVGWSVVVPTVLGTMVGIWLDQRYRGAHSWTLTLLVLGLIMGCLNAWMWISRQDREMREENKHDE